MNMGWWSNKYVPNVSVSYPIYWLKNRYIEEVGQKLGELSITGGEGTTFRDRLSRWRIEIESGAMNATAKVLKPPVIKFGNENVVHASNGSFNLNRTRFAR